MGNLAHNIFEGNAVYATLFIGFIIALRKFLHPLIQERSRGISLLKHVNSPRFHWLFGHLKTVKPTQEAILALVKECTTFPKMRQIWLGPFAYYLTLQHPHVLKSILKLAEPKDNMAYRFISPWIGDGLLVSSGKKWHRNRHLLTKLFHFNVLKHYVKVFDSCANTMLKKWDSVEDDAAIEIFGHVSLMTLDSMLQCTMSRVTDCQNMGSKHKYTSAVYQLTTIAMNRVFNPLYHNDFIFSLTSSGKKFKSACDYVHAYDEQVIQERKASLSALLKKNKNITGNQNEGGDRNDVKLITKLRQSSQKYLDFLDILLLTRDEEGQGLTDREIRDEVDTFLFEGHDTTASGISWAFYCLAAYPEYQEKCREEVQQLIGYKEEIQWKEMSNLSYLTMFIKEVLRLYPPVFSIARRIKNPVQFSRGFGEDQLHLGDEPVDIKNCSHTVKAPCNIAIPIITLHRNETVWDNPEVFDPSRFSVENCASRDAYAYIPFSAGPRNCIGQNFAMAEMKLVLVKMLQHFRLYRDEHCPSPKLNPMLVLKSTNGIYIKLDKLQ